MPPVTAIFAREQNLYLGKGSVPINIDFFLGLWNRTKYQYDAEGNRIARWIAGTTGETAPGQNANDHDITIYEWDYRNRLTGVKHYVNCSDYTGTTPNPDMVANYTYDVNNHLVRETVDNGNDGIDKQEAYVYDGQNMVLKFARGDGGAMTANDLTTRYLHGWAVDQILAEEHLLARSQEQGGGYDLTSPGNVLWMLTDNQGTVRDVADFVSGATSVVNHLQYGSFGEIRDQSNDDYAPTFSYTGRQFDEASGLFNYRARWYDAENGRFVSEDPSGFAAGDANLARYCGNSPTNFIDPSGRKSLAPEPTHHYQGKMIPVMAPVPVHHHFKMVPMMANGGGAGDGPTNGQSGGSGGSSGARLEPDGAVGIGPSISPVVYDPIVFTDEEVSTTINPLTTIPNHNEWDTKDVVQLLNITPTGRKIINDVIKFNKEHPGKAILVFPVGSISIKYKDPDPKRPGHFSTVQTQPIFDGLTNPNTHHIYICTKLNSIAAAGLLVHEAVHAMGDSSEDDAYTTQLTFLNELLQTRPWGWNNSNALHVVSPFMNAGMATLIQPSTREDGSWPLGIKLSPPGITAAINNPNGPYFIHPNRLYITPNERETSTIPYPYPAGGNGKAAQVFNLIK